MTDSVAFLRKGDIFYVRKCKKTAAFYFREQEKKSEDFIKDLTSDNGLKYWSTPGKWDKYQSGLITRHEAEEAAVARMKKILGRRLDASCDRIICAESEPEVKEIEVSVSWKENREYGNLDPVVEITLSFGAVKAPEVLTGTADGAGYEKISSAAAEALNESDAVLKMILDADEAEKRAVNAVNYSGPVPKFRRGVGMEAVEKAFSRFGFTFVSEDLDDDGFLEYLYYVKI
ncbi:MAG: hypothetical protein ACI4CS_00105 [Candidatus Weimeria sp.]